MTYFTLIPNLTRQYKYLIFLDVDGVLNSEDHGRRCCEGKASFIEREYNMCQTLCNTLEGMKHFGDDIAIVISSTRRFDYSLTYWNFIFKELFGMTIPIIGITPWCQSMVRGAEIKMWLTKHADEVTGSYRFKKYCIIDDDADMLIYQIPNFVQTNGYLGIHYNDINKACSFLANDPFYYIKENKS